MNGIPTLFLVTGGIISKCALPVWKWRAGPMPGVSHIDAGWALAGADDAYAQHILDYSQAKNMEISPMFFYSYALEPDLEKRAANIANVKM